MGPLCGQPISQPFLSHMTQDMFGEEQGHANQDTAEMRETQGWEVKPACPGVQMPEEA